MQQCRPQQENRAKVLPKNQISPSFFLKKQVMKAEKIRNLKELDLDLIPYGEKLYFFWHLGSRQPMKYIYNSRKERKRKKKEEKKE